MKNFWGEKINARQKFNWFVYFLSLFFSCAIIFPTVYYNWEAIVEFVEVEIFKSKSDAQKDNLNNSGILKDEEINNSQDAENSNNDEQTPNENETQTPNTPSEENPAEPEVPTEPEAPNEGEIPTDPENGGGGTGEGNEEEIAPPVTPENPNEEEETPTEPTDPDEPIDPETPVDPDPVEPEVPTEPEDPNEGGETPTDPENSGEGTGGNEEEVTPPVTPENPDEEEKLPTEPTDPDEPTEPETPVEPELTEEEKAFNSLFEKVQKLEELSKAYNETNYQLRALTFIRSARYSGTLWNTVAGSRDADFEAYVRANQGEYDLASFIDSPSQYSYFTIPATGETVDFYHLIAVMNGLYTGSASKGDLCGWAGDLVQMMGYFKDSSLTGEYLTMSVSLQFNAQNTYCGFGSADVCADFDAVNIVNDYKNGEYSSLTECLIDYYQNLTKSKRVKNYRNTTFGNDYSASTILSRLKSNIFITGVPILGIDGLATQEGATLGDEICMACIQVFVDYISSF